MFRRSLGWNSIVSCESILVSCFLVRGANFSQAVLWNDVCWSKIFFSSLCRLVLLYLFLYFFFLHSPYHYNFLFWFSWICPTWIGFSTQKTLLVRIRFDKPVMVISEKTSVKLDRFPDSTHDFRFPFSMLLLSGFRGRLKKSLYNLKLYDYYESKDADQIISLFMNKRISRPSCIFNECI